MSSLPDEPGAEVNRMNTDNISVNTQSSIRIAGSRILYFDPFRITEDARDADVIFITHGHYDHLDPGSIAKVINDGTVIIAPASVKNDLEKAADPARITYVKPGDEITAAGLAVKAVPAYNRLKPFHPRKNGWVGYLVNMDQVTYYIAGDTDALKENEKITCDIALVPIGGTYTMTAASAAELVNAIHPSAVIPTHYGSIVGSPGDADVFLEKLDSDIQADLKLVF